MTRLIPVLVLMSLANAFAAGPEFHADVAPVLRDYCAGCHNEDDYDGDFSVETFAAMMEGGESGEAIVPGDGHGSLLIKYLTGRTKKPMPPKKEPQPSGEEVAVLQAWIDAGAKGPAGKDVSILSTLIVPEVAVQPGLVKPIAAAEFSPDGKFFAVARYGEVEIFDAAMKKSIALLGGHEGKVNAVHFSKDGSRVVAASGTTGLRGVATIWEVATGKRIADLGIGHRDVLYDAEFSPDETLLATAGYDRRITIWEVATGKALHRIDVHNGAIFDLAFSPDGAVLASASGDETVKLWRVADGVRLDTLNQPTGEQYSVAFSPDGRFVFAGGADNRIRMWRFVSREKPRINPIVHARFAHEDAVVGVAVRPDGKGLVSASADGTVKTWKLPSLTLSEVLDGQPDLVSSIAMRPEGRSFRVARMDGSVGNFEFAARGNEGGVEVVVEEVHAFEDKMKFEITESEPNDRSKDAEMLKGAATITGAIQEEGDVDFFAFEAKRGEELVFEVNASRSKSPMDSKIEILHANGEPVERVVLRAVRDSWFTFRGKNSDVVNDFRVQNWREMELNEYLYANGEVVKLWHYPRGPDSGFNVYPGNGFKLRHTYFGTTAMAHPLGEPIYIVEALPAGSEPSPNGLPVFRLYYENDDDPQRRWGSDSSLMFEAPEDGKYLVRVRDVRGFGGEDFAYTLQVRPRKPDFKVVLEGKDLKLSPGSGNEFRIKVERIDGFDGEIRVDVEGLPEGFTVSGPIVVEEGQFLARGALYAAADAEAPAKEALKTKLVARATIAGEEVVREVGTLGEIGVREEAKLLVEVLPDGDSGSPVVEGGKPLELTIAPGETITARVKVERKDFTGRIEFGKEDAGRNLPHGVYVDNIGLNGLLIVEGQSERQFFITAADWVPETTRRFHLNWATGKGQASAPVILHVKNNVAD